MGFDTYNFFGRNQLKKTPCMYFIMRKIKSNAALSFAQNRFFGHQCEAWFGHWCDLFVFKRNCVKRRIASNNKMHLHLFLFEYWVWKCLFESEVGGIAAVHQSWQFPRNKFSLIRINPAPGAMCLLVSPAQLSLTFYGIAQETKL